MSDYNPLDHLDNIVNQPITHRDAQYLQRRKRVGTFVYCVCKSIKLENGGKLSVQASPTHYCTPRQSLTGPWTSVEVGFPEGVVLPEKWKDHADYPNCTGWRNAPVFGWVPVEWVRELILDNCPKLRAEMEAKDKELSKGMTASERKEWFDKHMR